MADLPGGVNPLDFLYKLSLQRGLPPPVFSQLYEEGPPHLKVFVWSCVFHGLDAKGTGRSKKEAKVAAATELKRNLDLSALPPVVEKKKRPNNKAESQLTQNARKKVKKDGARTAQGNATAHPFAMAPAITFESFRGYFLYDPKFAEDSIDVLPSPHFPGNVFSSRISKMDRFVFLKTYEIRPTDAELTHTRHLVETIESALTEVMNNLHSGDAKVFEARFRVGDLAKVTMLKGMRHVALVLMCFAIPTRSFLKDLEEKLRATLDVRDTEKKYKVELAEDHASLHTSLQEGDDTFHCNVLFTSRCLRRKPLGEEVIKTESDSEDIPLEKCLHALAEHRRARWVHVTSRSTPGYLDTVRIMKEIQLRDPVWATMSHWAMEVLVERALNTASLPPNPAACVMRVMEVIACGFLYNTSVGLRDPCEFGSVDVLNSMTELDRDTLTAKAQMQLRMMHFRKTDIVLDLHSNGDSDIGWHHGGNKKHQVGAKTDSTQATKDKQNGNGASVK